MARKSEGPWWRESKACWYVWHEGKLIRLHKDKEEAHRLWQLLLTGARSEESTETPAHALVPTQEPGREGANPQLPPASNSSLPLPVTVGELIDAYLADAVLRLKPSTLISKRKVLSRLKTDKGTEPAGSLKPAGVSAWLGKQRWGRSLR
jgi:hypothetical protein